MYTRVWVLNHPVVTVSTNGVHLWEPLFIWIERALPGLPEHPYILTTAAMCGRVRQFSLRLNLIQRICVKLFEDEELLELVQLDHVQEWRTLLMLQSGITEELEVQVVIENVKIDSTPLHIYMQKISLFYSL